jgi:hypothetical protein
MVRDLAKHHLASEIDIEQPDKQIYRMGDFNGDGNLDIAVLFTPNVSTKPSSELKISLPWQYTDAEATDSYRRSLAIFHGSSSEKFTSVVPPVFCLLDRLGVLETPSFSLLISRQGENGYPSNAKILPKPPEGDIIIIPTEAGIDTYVYWDLNQYRLFEPDEIP